MGRTALNFHSQNLGHLERDFSTLQSTSPIRIFNLKSEIRNPKSEI